MTSKPDLHQQMIDETLRLTGNDVVRALFDMNDRDRNAVLNAMADTKVKTVAIQAVLNRNGYNVSYDAVRRFRSKSVKIPSNWVF